MNVKKNKEMFIDHFLIMTSNLTGRKAFSDIYTGLEKFWIFDIINIYEYINTHD